MYYKDTSTTVLIFLMHQTILIMLEIVAENKKFLRITKINLWSHLATREIGVHLHTLVDHERKRSRERG